MNVEDSNIDLQVIKSAVSEMEKRDWFKEDSPLHQHMKWLIEQAERAEVYKKALMEIGAKHEPPASKIANDALWIADYRRNE